MFAGDPGLIPEACKHGSGFHHFGVGKIGVARGNQRGIVRVRDLAVLPEVMATQLNAKHIIVK